MTLLSGSIADKVSQLLRSRKTKMWIHYWSIFGLGREEVGSLLWALILFIHWQIWIISEHIISLCMCVCSVCVLCKVAVQCESQVNSRFHWWWWWCEDERAASIDTAHRNFKLRRMNLIILDFRKRLWKTNCFDCLSLFLFLFQKEELFALIILIFYMDFGDQKKDLL